MIDDLRKEAEKLREDLAEREKRMRGMKLEIETLIQERAELWITTDWTRERLKDVEKMIERADDEKEES